jgi:hypothetical protein
MENFMKFKLAIVSLIGMSILLIMSLLGNSDRVEYCSNIALGFFIALMAIKGFTAQALRDVFNLRRLKIFPIQKTAIVEFIIALEFVLLMNLPFVETRIYDKPASAIGNTVIAILATVIPLVIVYRVFFLNMFLEESEPSNQAIQNSKTNGEGRKRS